MSMKAIAITHHGTAERFAPAQVARPSPLETDLLVKVHAFSLNPVDYKIREGKKDGDPVVNDLKILGWDGSGVVEEVGSIVPGYKVGDEVFFSGSLSRSGCNAEYAVVDYRIAAIKPKSVDHLTASSFPLTALTAWEGLEEKLHIGIPEAGSKLEAINAKKVLLVVAGAGGVGSIVIQLAKKVFKIGTVVATAARADSQTWCRNMGADLILDRTKDWKSQLTDAGITGVHYIFSCHEVDEYVDTFTHIAHPLASVVGIVVNKQPLNIAPFFSKSMSFAWEFMGARPIHHWELERHGEILSSLSKLIDDGTIKSYVGETYKKATAANLKAGHILQQSGTAIGKIAFVADFE